METCEVNNAKHYSIGSQQDCMVTLLERITRLGAKKYMATYLFLFLYLSWAMRTHSEAVVSRTSGTVFRGNCETLRDGMTFDYQSASAEWV